MTKQTEFCPGILIDWRATVDGGKIIYFLDCGHLAMLIFPTFWFEATFQGKFMLNIAFGQSKYYVDSLSENTKRGLRQKVRRGEYPSLAPVGYLNDPRTKTVVVDKRIAHIVSAPLSFMRKETRHSKISENILNKTASFPKVERESTSPERLLSSLILSTPDYFVTPAKYTRASTSQ